MYLINGVVKNETLIQIGIDIGILPEGAEVNNANIEKVIRATWFSIDINIPMHTVDSRITDGRFELLIGN